jgi:site-specific recombinase XerD
MDFLFYTGVRVSELVNIKHRDLWENNGLRILGKGNKIRYIFLPEFLIEHIKLGSIGYLFKNSKGSRISNRQVRKMICQRVKLAKLNKWISPHSFRRSFATLLDRKGARMSTIQKLLGHNDINTTLGYIHNNYEILYQDYSKLWKNEANISVS